MKIERLRPIMFAGTGSDVGKSIINTAFCRILLQDGYSPAPFKAQNMSLNSYATKDQLEIGRAQAVQAEACGIECTADMNPILLKPTSHTCSQVVLNGKPSGNKNAAEYFSGAGGDKLFKAVTKAYDNLANTYNPIVLEGAGSISELNLKSRDIVNMRMALYSKAAVYLVADIDRGGVFASVYGSIMLLPQEERTLIKGIIINKFRGDINLFKEGSRMIEELTGIPVVGVLPWFDDIEIDQEDSVILERRVAKIDADKVTIAVVHLRHMSNFTDFGPLEQLSNINLVYTRDPAVIEEADIVIIPGSKNTIEDLNNLRKSSLAGSLLRRHKAGKSIYGICGGFQIMGKWIYDPNHIEGDIEAAPGLGIFPVETTLLPGKRSRRCSFTLINSNGCGDGYEIHSGETSTDNPFATLDTGEADGYFLNSKTWGTYIHGIFDNPSVISLILDDLNIKNPAIMEKRESKEDNYNKLAKWFRDNSNISYIYDTLRK